MAEKKPGEGRALPRFTPKMSAAPKMPVSQSVDERLNKIGLPRHHERGPRPLPVHKPRQLRTIEFKDHPIPIHQPKAEIFHSPQPTVPRSSDLSDRLDSDICSAVKLPLVPDTEHIPNAAEILEKSDADKLMLVQLPSALPIIYPNDVSQIDYHPLFAAADGFIGQIRIHASGKVTAKLGNVTFDVSEGIAPSCAQMICLKKGSGLEHAPVSGNKIKFTLDVDRIESDVKAEGPA
jgi:hypothetical protein